jgi:2-keto-4-pentenoate hydratase/2-oxohepta-3-ene-1,7-dioic acid hydratase in catechol pathway
MLGNRMRAGMSRSVVCVHLVTYRFPTHGPAWIAGVLDGSAVLNAGGLLGRADPLDMLGLLDLGQRGLDRLQSEFDQFHQNYSDNALLPEQITAPSWLAEFAAPLPYPRSIRDFYAYEAHVQAGYERRGRPIPEVWYQLPVFFYQHAGSVFGSDALIPYPQGSEQLDFELELAVVIGTAGRDINESSAWSHVAGLTIFNDWSARDLQQREMSVGLGPAKAKDFANSIGPSIVTLDELAPYLENDRHQLHANVRIDGEEIARTNAGDLFWSVPQIIAHASRQVTLRPGDLLGLGTMAKGCLLELGEEAHAWLQPGDEVELEIEGIGKLRNRIGD